MTAARTLTDADIEAIRAIVREVVREERGARRRRPEPVDEPPPIDELAIRRADAELVRQGLVPAAITRGRGRMRR